MFERYTERARRAIFFARYEASQFGTPFIEAEFLLLALFREDKHLMQRFMAAPDAEAQIRKEVERNTVQGPKLSTSVDLPLSDACKRVLAYASEEADRLGHQHTGNEHLLLGLVREGQSLSARLLLRYGVTAAGLRESLALQQGPAPARSPGIGAGSRSIPFSVPVTTIKVSDLGRSRAFYAALGFALTQEMHFGQIALMQSGPFPVALVHASVAADLLCFQVGDVAAIEFQLHRAGHNPMQPMTTSENGTQTLLIRDPDGHLVLLVSSRFPARNA